MKTILSYGAGQDSHAILIKAIFDPEFRAAHIKGDLIVLMADTMNEHDHTKAHIEKVSKFLAGLGIPFHITGDEYLTNSWKGGLLGQWGRGTASVGSKAYPKTCTDNLKIRPIYKFIADMLESEGYGDAYHKKSLYGYTKAHGKLKVLIGISKGEEKRAKGSSEAKDKWMRENIEISYPLIDEGMDRSACQKYLKSMESETGIPCPMPSNCVFCPFNQEFDLVWLHRNHPDQLKQWMEFEANKLASDKDVRNQPIEKSLGVWGKPRMTLADNLSDGIKKFGHMADEELHEYKFSHGHCVSSAF